MDFRIDHVDGGAVFRLTRPQKLNSGTLEIWSGFERLLDVLEGGGGRFLIITGEGTQSFCAGTDLGDTTSLSADEVADRCDYTRNLLLRLSRSALISVAALNGLAFGGGLELAAACTFRVAAPHVRLSLPEVKLGSIPAYGGTQFVTAIVGPAIALDLMLTGRSVMVDEALQIGLVSRKIDPEADVVEEALVLARSVCRFSRPAVAAIRHAVAAAGPLPTNDGLALEGALAREIFSGEDCREGTAAFLEKRTPHFKDR